MKRISVDIGGTFTDCFFAWEGQYIQAKALTTHHNLAQGFNEALDHAVANSAWIAGGVGRSGFGAVMQQRSARTR
jgi:N-methylhydantoinase A/oxoprolinase/acetone carboxylase beta subunit